VQKASRRGSFDKVEGSETRALTTQEIIIDPVAKPRQTKADQWKQRPCVVKYRNFCDQLRLAKPRPNWDKLSITFIIPMPKSWSKKKKAEMNNQPHKDRPDIDNLTKSIFDALLEEDSEVWRVTGLRKYWGYEGKIIFHPSKHPVHLPQTEPQELRQLELGLQRQLRGQG
jgi:Holliday junction resolvase RusA-like endonuclease